MPSGKDEELGAYKRSKWARVMLWVILSGVIIGALLGITNIVISSVTLNRVNSPVTVASAPADSSTTTTTPVADTDVCNLAYLQPLLPAILAQLSCDSSPIAGMNAQCWPAYALSISSASFGSISLFGEPAVNGCTIQAQIDTETLLVLRFPTLANFDGHICQMSEGGLQGQNWLECRSFHDGMISIANTEGHVCCNDYGYFPDDWGLNSTVNTITGLTWGRMRNIDGMSGRSQHIANKFVKLLANRYYSSAQKSVLYSIGVGGSAGGAKNLVLTRMWPNMFKGIVVNSAPSLVSDFLVSFMWSLRVAYPTMARYLDPNDAGDYPNPNGPVPWGKQLLLHYYVESKCDAQDGVADNITSWATRCNFDPRVDVPACPINTNRPDCLTPAEAIAFNKLYQGPPSLSSSSRAIQEDPASELGWGGWVHRGSNADAFSLNCALSLFPSYNVDANRGLNEMYAVWNYSFTSATDYQTLVNSMYPNIQLTEDWSRFIAAGGKVMEFTTGADGSSIGIGYATQRYKRLVKYTGGFPKLQNSWRLFVEPEQYHAIEPTYPGTGYSGTAHPTGNQRQVLQQFRLWLEQGVVPTLVPGSRDAATGIPLYPYPNTGSVAAQTTKFCSYPNLLRYIGFGNTLDANNFYCEKRNNMVQQAPGEDTCLTPNCQGDATV